MSPWEPYAPADYLPHLEAVSARFADVLAGGPLDAPVAACPGWTLGDLGHHLGNVQRWATYALEFNAAGEEGEGGPTEPAALAAWMREGTAGLLGALRSTDPQSECWNFGPKPRTASFWFRRQAQEAAVHTWDALAAAGLPAEVDARLAADGIDEVARMFFPRQVRLLRCEPLPFTLGLVADDAGGAWTIGRAGSEPVGDVGLADAVVRGPAEAVLLLLWKRVRLDDPRLRVDGDLAAARAVLAAPIVP